MVIVVSVIGLAFAAFCVWLGVRIVNRRERWAKWTAAGLVIGMPILYVLSFGPVIWLTTRHMLWDSVDAQLEQFYMPLGWLYVHGPEPVSDGLEWYTELWRKPDTVYDSAPVIPSPEMSPSPEIQ